MEYRRRYFIAIIVAVIAFIMVLVIGKSLMKVKSREEKDLTYVEQYAQKVTDRNYDIMYYGGDLGLPENFRVRKIFNFEDYTLEGQDAPKGHGGHMIIIYDPNDEYYLTPEQAQVLKDLYDNENYRIAAVGKGKIRVLESVGLCKEGTAEKVNSTMVWKTNSGIGTEAAGIADSKELIPYSVEQDTDPQYIQAYALMMELGTKEIYWN
jgi:hypothetical protein